MTDTLEPTPTASPAPEPPWLDSRSGTAVAIVLVVFAFFGFGNPLIGIPAALLVIWLLSRAAGWGWRNLGFRRPASWPLTVLGAVVFAAAFQLFAWKVILPLLEWAGVAPPDLTAFAAMRGNVPMFLTYLAVSWTTAGFGEEIICRGFLLPRTTKLLGGGRGAWGLALLVTSIGFGLLHFYQGPTGMVLTGVTGFVLGCVYLMAGKNLWPAILAHGFLDSFAFLLLFLGWFEITG